MDFYTTRRISKKWSKLYQINGSESISTSRECVLEVFIIVRKIWAIFKNDRKWARCAKIRSILSRPCVERFSILLDHSEGISTWSSRTGAECWSKCFSMLFCCIYNAKMPCGTGGKPSTMVSTGGTRRAEGIATQRHTYTRAHAQTYTRAHTRTCKDAQTHAHTHTRARAKVKLKDDRNVIMTERTVKKELRKFIRNSNGKTKTPKACQ